MQPIQEVVVGALERWNAGDLDGYLALYAPNIRLHGYSPEPMMLAAVRDFYQSVWNGLASHARPNPLLVVEDMLVVGDRITIRARMNGTHVGPFMGIPATGRSYEIPVIAILRFDGGRCVERWSCADMLSLMVQVGAFAPPALAA